MEKIVFSDPLEEGTELTLKKIVVGYDASPAAEHALSDAITLGHRFHAEILLVQAMAPDDEPANSLIALRDEQALEFRDLEAVRGRLDAMGVRSRGIVRNGIVGDTLFNICCEEHADLLLMGAYGYSIQDRQTLGSTAETLLRAIPCPVLTYGPEVCFAFDSEVHRGPVVIPVSLPCNPGTLEVAIKIAKLLGVGLEVLHVADHVHATVVRDLERECQLLADRLRSAGTRAQWSLYCGTPENIICARAGAIDSPFILMPLRWGHRLSSLTSDNVAAHVIRRAKIPVMTYRTS